MSERSGFYPSNPKANIFREYKGYEIGDNIYQDIVSNGVFARQSDFLQVFATTGMQVKVNPGRGIFYNLWYENTEDIIFTLDGQSSLNRIDLIVIEANRSPNVLRSYAKVVKGTPSATPVEPEILDNEFIKQYPLAAVRITGGITTITQSAITDKRGIAPTLWVTGVIDQLDTTTLWNQFTTAFWEWFTNVKDTLSTTTLMRKFTGAVYTTNANQVDIEIPIPEYNSVLDILQVHIEGRILREGVDYFKNGFTGITLSTALPLTNTQVYFEIFKSVDGSDAESIASLLYQLQDRVNVSIVTKSDGTDKIVVVSNLAQEVLNAGVGFHTIYVPNTIANMPVENKVWRGVASFSSATRGYILLTNDEGDVYIINHINGSWYPWRCLYKHNVNFVYTSTGNFANANFNIPLSKALSNCANGLVFHFAKYGNTNDMNFHYHLPKVRFDKTKWNGQNICIEMPYEFSEDGNTRNTCMKKFTIYDNQITGFVANALGTSANMVLVGISEY